MTCARSCELRWRKSKVSVVVTNDVVPFAVVGLRLIALFFHFFGALVKQYRREGMHMNKDIDPRHRRKEPQPGGGTLIF